jgi:phosphoribosylanthranilate isomerase
MCLKLGVDILGFVTEYPLPVPWNLSRDKTRALLRLVLPAHRSCLVTGGSPAKVIELAADQRPSLVQLHYQETLEETRIIAAALRELNIGVIKTVPTLRSERILQFGTADLEMIVEKLCKTRVYGLLADTRSPANASENGNALDHKFCKQIISWSSKPVIIAGGINAGNVRALLSSTQSKFIDVMTGVESHPGKKDEAKLGQLLASIRNL